MWVIQATIDANLALPSQPPLTVAMVAFIADVFDGYGRFRDQETLVNKEEGVTDTQLLLRILGYQYDREGGTKEVHDDAVEADELRFRRTPDAISTQSTEAGLPIVAPATEGPYSPSNG
ncbi:hypothetical protein CGRA01v4_11744 [Colletotrichum graminicola]|nr:hypothetical protein CGRA01v4_11744 [Colletotrichum graminicola]